MLHDLVLGPLLIYTFFLSDLIQFLFWWFLNLSPVWLLCTLAFCLIIVSILHLKLNIQNWSFDSFHFPILIPSSVFPSVAQAQTFGVMIGVSLSFSPSSSTLINRVTITLKIHPETHHILPPPQLTGPLVQAMFYLHYCNSLPAPNFYSTLNPL